MSHGFVTKWMYFPKAPDPFLAIVFRPSTTTQNVFTVVGINDIASGVANAANTVTVPDDEHILVQPLDVVGFAHYAGVNPRIAWDDLGSTAGSMKWFDYVLSGSFYVGMSVQATREVIREVSFQAEVTNITDFPSGMLGHI